MLESVSVFFQADCDEHGEAFEATSCCSTGKGNACAKENMDCCEDESAFLLQDTDSLVRYHDLWIGGATAPQEFNLPIPSENSSVSPAIPHHVYTDSGPPIYILFSSLIFYA